MAYVTKENRVRANRLRDGRADIGTLAPKKGSLNYGGALEFAPLFSVWYGRLGVTASEQYTAQQANTVIDRRIAVRADKRITRASGVRIDGAHYKIARLFENQDGKYVELSLTGVTL